MRFWFRSSDSSDVDKLELALLRLHNNLANWGTELVWGDLLDELE